MNQQVHIQHRSTKPYLIRAIYDWCTDHGLTPYLAVKVDSHTRVPMEYVQNGEIVLNLSANAARNLQLSNNEISCAARFGGVPHEIVVPIAAVVGIFAKETGEGLVFDGQEPDMSPDDNNEGPPSKGGRPHLHIVK